MGMSDMNKRRMQMIISVAMIACIVFGCGNNTEMTVTEASEESEVMTEETDAAEVSVIDGGKQDN